jgi:hypothetical protein
VANVPATTEPNIAFPGPSPSDSRGGGTLLGPFASSVTGGDQVV